MNSTSADKILSGESSQLASEQNLQQTSDAPNDSEEFFDCIDEEQKLQEPNEERKTSNLHEEEKK